MAIKEGKLEDSFAQNPELMGEYVITRVALNLMKREEVEPLIPAEVILITKDNVDEALENYNNFIFPWNT